MRIGIELEGAALWHLTLTTATYFGAPAIARLASDVGAVRRVGRRVSRRRLRRAILGGE